MIDLLRFSLLCSSAYGAFFADYDTREHEAGVSLDGMRDPVLHVARRRPWARGMNNAAMKHYEELLRETVGDLVRAFKSRENEVVDVSTWMTYFG